MTGLLVNGYMGTNILMVLRQLYSDARYSLRSLARNPGTALAAIVSLGLGMGLNSTLFTFVHASFFAPLRVTKPDSLITLYTKLEGQPRLLPVSLPNIKDISAQAAAFSGIAAYQSTQVMVGDSPRPEQVWAQIVSGNFFDLLGIKPAAGRMFLPREGLVPGQDPLVVLSHDFWATRFSSDPTILGRTISINNHQFTVIGVAAEGFRGPSKLFSCQLWVPLSMAGQIYSDAQFVNERSWQIFRVIARLRPGVMKEAAQGELTNIGRRLEQLYPQANGGQTFVLLPFQESLLGTNQRALYVRAATVLSLLFALVLFLACSNVANLFLARVLERDREIAIRLAIGASQGNVTRLLLTESLILALFAGMAAALVAGLAAPLLWNFRPPDIPREGLDLTPKPAVLAFTIAISLIASALVWAAPMWHLHRHDLSAWLRDLCGQQRSGFRQPRLRSLLMVAQAAFAFLSVSTSILLLLNFRQISRIDPGFESQRLLLLACTPKDQGYTEARGRRLYERMVAEVRRLPGVRAAALSENILLKPVHLVRRVIVTDSDQPELRKGLLVPTSSVSAGYFEAVGIALLEGRELDSTHHQGVAAEAMVNHAFAQLAWKNRSPLGRTLRLDDDAAAVIVVGVVRDSRYESLTEGATPHVFLSLDRYYSPSAALYVRTERSAESYRGALVTSLGSALPELSVSSVKTIRELIDESLWASRAGVVLLGSFGTASLFLALLGTYCLTRRSVQQRRHEIGIRMALGANQGRILWMILGQTLKVTSLGILFGGLAVVGFSHLLARILYDPAIFGPGPLLAVGAALLLAAGIACALPARNALSLAPQNVIGMDG